MGTSPRSYLTSGVTSAVSLAAATAIAFAPLAVPTHHDLVAIPRVTVADLRLAVSAADIAALVANLQAALDDGTAAAAEVAGLPGQTLIGVVSGIVTLLDGSFSGLIDATDNPTLAASLTILKTLSVDAFAKLHENLGLINPVITATTAQVGELVTSALTGSLQNALTGVLNLATNPLAPGTYTGLLSAGVQSAQLLVGNGLKTVQTLGDGGFDIAQIAVNEVTFQFNNAVTRLGDLITQLGDASDNAVVETLVAAVKGLVIAPALSVFNGGSTVVKTVLTTTNTVFDQLVGGATSIVGSPGTTLRSADVSPNLTTVTLPIPKRQLTNQPSAGAAPAVDKRASKATLTADAPAKDTSAIPPSPSADLSPATGSLSKGKGTQNKTTARTFHRHEKANAKSKGAQENHSNEKAGAANSGGDGSS